MGVVVNSVRVLNTKFKNKRTRFGKYKTSTYKKAYVTLAEGKEINMENPLNKMAIIKAKPTSPEEGLGFKLEKSFTKAGLKNSC